MPVTIWSWLDRDIKVMQEPYQGERVENEEGHGIGTVWQPYQRRTTWPRTWSARWYWGEFGENTVQEGFTTKEAATEWVREMEAQGVVPMPNRDEWEQEVTEAKALVEAAGGEVPEGLWGRP